MFAVRASPGCEARSCSPKFSRARYPCPNPPPRSARIPPRWPSSSATRSRPEGSDAVFALYGAVPVRPGPGYYSAGKTVRSRVATSSPHPSWQPVRPLRGVALAPTLQDFDGTGDVLELAAAAAPSPSTARRARPLGWRRGASTSSNPVPTCASASARAWRRPCPRTWPPARDWLDRPPEADWRGVLFANEVIDALPPRASSIRDDEVFEEHVVDVGDGGFASVDLPGRRLRGPGGAGDRARIAAALRRRLPPELLPQLPHWLQAVTGSLRRAWPLHRLRLRAARVLPARAPRRHPGGALPPPGPRRSLTCCPACRTSPPRRLRRLAIAARGAGFDLAGWAARPTSCSPTACRNSSPRPRLPRLTRRRAMYPGAGGQTPDPAGEMGERFKGHRLFPLNAAPVRCGLLSPARRWWRQLRRVASVAA